MPLRVVKMRSALVSNQSEIERNLRPRFAEAAQPVQRVKPLFGEDVDGIERICRSLSNVTVREGKVSARQVRYEPGVNGFGRGFENGAFNLHSVLGRCLASLKFDTRPPIPN